MVKTDTQTGVTGAGRESVKGSKAGTERSNPELRTMEPARSEAGRARSGETMDVARAQEVYTRTEQVPRVSESPIETSLEARLVAEKVAAQLKEEGGEAIKAQASGVSAHLVELLSQKGDT